MFRAPSTPRTTKPTNPDVDEALTALLDALGVEVNPSAPGEVTLRLQLQLWPWNSQHQGMLTVKEDGQPALHVNVEVPA